MALHKRNSGVESSRELFKGSKYSASLVVCRGGARSRVPELIPARFCNFLSDADPESKIWEKTDLESLFNFGSSRSLCGHFLNNNMGKLRLD